MDAAAFAATVAVACTALWRRATQRKAAPVNAPAFAQLLRAAVADGVEHLQLVLDFDRTMTTTDSDSSHGMLEVMRSPAFQAKAKAMLDFYLPIETDTRLSIAEKLPHMLEWYDRAHADFLADGFHADDIDAAVAASRVVLRPGTEELLELARRHGIPVLVFSAGVGNVIECFLRRRGLAHPQLHVVSNMMLFDDATGKLTGFTSPIIHMYNKCEEHLRASPLYPTLVARRTVLVAGDSLGDATMADGLPHATVIKVGLLNRRVEESRAKYAAAFDAVVPYDGSLWPLVHLVRAVVERDAGVADAIACTGFLPG